MKLTKRRIDIDSWDRKNHYEFFKGFKEPFFGVTVEVDCTVAMAQAKKLEVSFFLYYLYHSLKAVNEIEAFKLRMEDGEVTHYEKINPGPTVGRENGTFGFCEFEYQENFNEFIREASIAMQATKSKNDLTPSPRLDLIYYSAIPWVNFTSLSHARDLDRFDCVPKISFGKVFEKGERQMMAMSVHVHHALADGLHVGQYVDLFQKYMNEPL